MSHVEKAVKPEAIMDRQQSLLSKLDRLLRLEIDAYEQLLEIQQAEKRLLTIHALDAFITNLQDKERLTRKIISIEDKRQAVLDDLAPLLQLHPTTLTLRQLSARIGEPLSSTFLRHRLRLQQLVGTLQRHNREHEQLLRASLAFVESALAFFEPFMPVNATYRESGTFSSPRQGRLLSGKV